MLEKLGDQSFQVQLMFMWPFIGVGVMFIHMGLAMIFDWR
jgi:hypothetical protein